jgi:ubiquinone/menaquinone biosynthesis C-methylase UbiE
VSESVKGYVLRGGDVGAERLALLARVKWPTTRDLLRKAGMRKGAHCLDVGCGGGAVAMQMARAVGPEGRVVGIDLDRRLIDLAGEAVRRRKTATVSFRCADAITFDENAAFDLVFARFLLTHLTHPLEALRHMVRAAKPGGVVAIEDIDFPGSFCHPPCPAFARYVELYQAVVRRTGGDPAIGPRLYVLAADAGLKELSMNVFVPTFHSGEGKLLAPVTMEHIRESVVAAGLADDREVDGIVAELNAFVADETSIVSLPRIFQIWGKRA